MIAFFVTLLQLFWPSITRETIIIMRNLKFKRNAHIGIIIKTFGVAFYYVRIYSLNIEELEIDFWLR